MKTLIPWTNLPTFRQELDRLFTRFEDEPFAPTALAEWIPAIDVTEANGDFVVKLECPGMDAKDLHVRMENGLLTIEGEKKVDHEEKVDKSYRRERMFGSFSRDLRLPKPTDGTKIKARLLNGVLTLNVPKATSVTEKKDIPIQVG